LPKSKRRQLLREVPGGITAPCGFEAAGVRCGIKAKGLDLALICTLSPAVAAGVFTTNRFQAAPVLVTKDRVSRESIRALIVNSGNANACTGRRGYRDALRTTELTGEALDIPHSSLLVCSTGVIGVYLPMRKLGAGIKKAVTALGPDGGTAAAEAIMTTDTRSKTIAIEFELDGRPIRVGGMAKGSGMIAPNMATMLAFLTTDAHLAPGVLQSCLESAVEHSFNRITVDGDTSTNDMVILLANSQAEAGRITRRHGLPRFQAALDRVCAHLAQEIVRDGEGASRFIEIHVRGAASDRDAQKIARAIANSPLVKTAIAGGDPNWGRIAAAAGRAGVQFQPDLVDIRLGDIRVMRNGAVCKHDLRVTRQAARGREVHITVDLNAGKREALVWTCDLTADYVHINADYHT